MRRKLIQRHAREVHFEAGVAARQGAAITPPVPPGKVNVSPIAKFSPIDVIVYQSMPPFKTFVILALAPEPLLPTFGVKVTGVVVTL